MARKHLPLTIVRPSVESLQAITFTASVSGTPFQIPFRYPFVDIANYSALVSAEYFRHTNEVSSDLGGSITTNVATKLGFELPNVEKLILLARTNGTVATSVTTITITGSSKYGKANVVYTIALDAADDSVYEIDLYNFGLYINSGEVTITVASVTTANVAKIELALIARMA